jgi:hypothetical protein
MSQCPDNKLTDALTLVGDTFSELEILQFSASPLREFDIPVLDAYEMDDAELDGID